MPPIGTTEETKMIKPSMFFSVAAEKNYSSIYVYSASILFEMFLYGLYTALFFICVRVLLKSHRTSQKIMLTCATAMFALATCDVILALAYMYWFVVRNMEIPDNHLHLKFLIYITSNIIADCLVIYRCYTVWNNNKRIIALPCFLLLGGSVCGYLFIGLSGEEYRFRDLLTAFMFTTVAVNIIITSLMAGRIWWISRKAHSILGPGLSRKYNAAIAIIIESGLIYSVYVILDAALDIYALDAGLAQMVGIAPTLMIVQIGLGHNSHDANTTISMVRTEARAATTCDSDFDPPSPIPTPQTTQVSPIVIPGQQPHYEEFRVS